MNLCIDIETELIGRGRLAPRVACVSIFSDREHLLLSPDDAIPYIKQFTSSGGMLIGHNIAFDLYALCRHEPSFAFDVWVYYEQNRIFDTGIFERLYALYHGWTGHPQIGKPIISNGVSLSQLALTVGIDMGNTKFDPDSPRFNYGRLIGTDPKTWTDTDRKYALDDSRITYKVFENQMARLSKLEHFDRNKFELYSFSAQCQADWALHHLRAWGLKTDPKKVAAWFLDKKNQKNQLKESLVATGLLDANGKRNMKGIKAVIELTYGSDCPRTEKGAIQTSTEVLEDSNEPRLLKLAEWMSLDKLTGTFGKTLELGLKYPISPRWNVLVRSGRTSCTNPNMQQLPQKGGVRECFIPRDGYCFLGADYSTAELVALAQICENFGFKSEMAAAIRAGEDLHLSLAADLAGITYEEAVKRKKDKDPHILQLRKLAKIPNFGLSGGLSAAGLTSFAKGYNMHLTLQEAEDLKTAWFKRWTEMRLYFDRIRQDKRRGYLIQEISGRRRGAIGFTDGANSYFQGLVADGAKKALYEVVKQCFMVKKSGLYGCRPILFIHDEIILECPIDRVQVAAVELEKQMIDAMKMFIRDLPVQVDSWASMVWTKGLESETDTEGNLIIQYRD